MATLDLPPSFHPSTCVRQGLIKTVTNHEVYYELHASVGSTPTRDQDKVLLMCGMYSTASSALHTLSHLTARPGFLVLVLDNRGVGLSGAPRGRYTTRQMSQDVVAVLDENGWTEDRSIHVVGVSLGGMIAQELALAVPGRIASLILTSTRAGPIPEFPSLKVGSMLARQITRTVRGPEHQAALAVDCLFPSTWLDQSDERFEGKTRRAVLEKEYIRKAEGKQPTAAGKLGQFAAVTSHYVSRRKLGSVLSTIPRCHIIVGDQDQLIAPRRSAQLHDMIPGSTFRSVKGGGHTLPLQFEEEYHGWITDVIEEAKLKIAQFGTDSSPLSSSSSSISSFSASSTSIEEKGTRVRGDYRHEVPLDLDIMTPGDM